METIILICLTLQLGHPSFAEREQATATLSRVSPEAYLLWGCRSQDAEIAARCHHLLNDHYWQVSLKLRPTKWQWQPWIDSLNYDYPERYPTITAYLDLVGKCPQIGGGSGAPTWPQYRQATQLFIYHQLKAGKSRADLVKLLDSMVDYEKGWINKNKHSYTFSSEILEAARK